MKIYFSLTVFYVYGEQGQMNIYTPPQKMEIEINPMVKCCFHSLLFSLDSILNLENMD